MKFISIPKNGSSWRGRLPYSFSTESDEPQDVTVEILNHTTGSLLGTMRLYGVVGGEVDIAPYVRPHVTMEPYETTKPAELMVSPSAISVEVRIGDVVSGARVFFRSEFNYNIVGFLSSKPGSQPMLNGETIRLTLFAISKLEASVTILGDEEFTIKCEAQTYGMPMEFVVPAPSVKDAVGVNITLRCDGKRSLVYTYNFVPRTNSAQRLVWYSANGGVESYLFCHAMHLNYSVSKSEDGICGAGSVDGRVRYRLCSGYELQSEMDRISQLLLSPKLYREVDGVCREVELESRDIEFDTKGLLHTLKLDLREKWEGGKLW